MRSSSVFLALIVAFGALFAVEVSARVLFPPLTFLTTLAINDPLASGRCLCTGKPASVYGNTDASWQLYQGCQTGQILQQAYNGVNYIEYGGIGGTASSYIDLGVAVPNVTWSSYAGSLHYFPDNGTFGYETPSNAYQIPMNVTGALKTTSSSWLHTANFSVGKFYLARVSNSPQTTMAGTSVLFSVAIVAPETVRWTIFYADEKLAADCFVTIANDQRTDATLMSNTDVIIFVSVGVGGTLLVLALVALLLNRKINNLRQSEYSSLK